MRTVIVDMVRAIRPYDALEQEHVAATIAWLESGAPFYRIAKPATPPQHLVSYFVLVDPAADHILLVDHKKAGLWLPSGGHVEAGEHPEATVRRELWEELHLSAQFLFPQPICSGSLGLDRSQSVVASVQYKEVQHAQATDIHRQV
jgi:8-oxo-dGTP diphosphatase